MPSQSSTRPVVVVGAGAAGLMAAVSAARGRCPVLLLEGTNRPGRKILISGGGRCNVLPSRVAPGDFTTEGSPHTLAKILRAWPLAEVRRFFEQELSVPLRLEEETGKLFPATNRARVVLDALLGAVRDRGAECRLGARVVGLTPGDDWQVRLASGESIAASRVVMATGGLSVPATGSDGVGLRIVDGLGHAIAPTYPALVPLTGDNPAHHALAGLSLTVTLTASLPQGSRPHCSHGGFLFTHRGYSGPAVLNLSHLVTRSVCLGAPRPSLRVGWTGVDAATWDARLRAGSGLVLPLLRQYLPERLAAQLVAESGLENAQLSQLRRDERRRLVDVLTDYPLPWSGHQGYRVAEVTGGGIPLGQVDPATLESRLVPGLFLCGEMLDAFGPIGGYNFLWAWVTGRIAGLASNA